MSVKSDMKTKGKIDQLKEGLKSHVVDTTALLAESNPVFVAFEVGLAGMSNAVSLNSKFIVAGISYGGVGSLFSRGRDLSRRLCHVRDETSEVLQHAHDLGYTAVFNLVASPIIYYAAGSRDFKEMAIATGSSMLFGGANGSLVGYAVDVFRDLTGTRECNRSSYPNFIKRQNSKVKKTIAAGLVATSIGLMSGIYALNSDKQESANQEPSRIEQIVDYVGAE
jgi:hypothetical protein